MQYHRIYARIDIDAILHNLGECKRRIPEGTKVLAVIKADGYGHGAAAAAKGILPHDLRGFPPHLRAASAKSQGDL